MSSSLPITAPRRIRRDSHFSFPRIDKGSRTKDFLTERARATNLFVLLLVGISIMSLLGNINSYFVRDIQRTTIPIPLSIRSTLQSPHSDLHHLILVPGHAIWTGCEATDATRDADWILEPMQTGGSVKTFISHITHASQLAVKDPESLLIYSGGQTRAHSDMSEATSYARLAKAGNIYAQFANEDSDHRFGIEFERVTTEEYALDSFENILFSIARFKEFTGNYPTRSLSNIRKSKRKLTNGAVTVVGFGMKRRRYEDVHRASLRWPSTAFTYVGIDNENTLGEDYAGERVGGLEPFVRDSYGCKGVLAAKRRKRNPFRRMHPYHSSSPELRALLEYCPAGNEMFDGPLPWSA